jgi:hypothetical protein
MSLGIHFPILLCPNKSTISRLVNRFRDTGSVQDRKRSGRPSVFCDDSLDDIRQTLLPDFSTILYKHIPRLFSDQLPNFILGNYGQVSSVVARWQ